MAARTSDILVIGGGVGGLSAAAALSSHAAVTVLEAEAQVGFHSSGRSATMFHYALGNPLIRALTRASRDLFHDPPELFAGVAHPVPILVHARADELAALDAAEADMAPFTRLDRIDADDMTAICPILKVGEGAAVAGLLDPASLRIDPHALLQGYLRTLRAQGGGLLSGQRVAKIERSGEAWQVSSDVGEHFEAPLLVNAAGAWGDWIAELAAVSPIGLSPRRRTIITFDAPSGVDPARLPFVKTVGDELYFSGESGRLFASPMDEGESEPCDSQPDEVDIATAAYRMEQRTTVEVRRIHARWSGLRTFAPDKSPVIGFAPDADGFFWCVGQGGSGLQTSPGSAAAVESLIAGTAWPIEGFGPELLAPDRFARQAA